MKFETTRKRTRINKYIKDGLNSIGVVNDDEIIELLEQVDKLVIDYRARENLLRDKDIFKAILFEGKTQKEVAEKYNISHSRIHQICFRLYLRLKTVKCEQLKEQRSKRMNKERAIEILKTIRHNSTMQTDYTIDDIDQALDIAIESLREKEYRYWKSYKPITEPIPLQELLDKMERIANESEIKSEEDKKFKEGLNSALGIIRMELESGNIKGVE